MAYKLFYWELPFRGNFVRLILADAGIKFSEYATEKIIKIMETEPSQQIFPCMAPPILYDTESEIYLSQMPAIVFYLSEKLGFMPRDKVKKSISHKLILDCNDVLTEITRFNGTKMWEHSEWKEFRFKRLVRWMKIFEETGKRFGLENNKGFILGGKKISLADISTFALFGTMTSCLPQLKNDLAQHAPYIASLCERIAARENINKFLKKQKKKTGEYYCGGEIEKSIREMLKIDKSHLILGT